MMKPEAPKKNIPDQIRDLQETVHWMFRDGFIPFPQKTTIDNALAGIARDYKLLHQPIIRPADKDKYIPLAMQAANVLVKLRCALSVDGDIDTVPAENAIAETAKVIALGLADVLNLEKA